MNNERGFTLIELIVATALTAVLGTLLLSLVKTTASQVTRIQDEAAIDATLFATAEQLRTDIRNLYWSGRDPRTDLTGLTRLINGKRMDTIRYATIRIPWDGTSTGHARPFAVQFEPLQNRLQQTVQELADGKPLATQPIPEAVIPLLLECKIQYHTGEQWQDQWSTQGQQRLPVAIAIRLTAGTLTGPPHTLNTIFVPTRALTASITG